MPDGAVAVITVAREYGAGGSELAKALGERLGWPVLDHELVKRVAERLGLDSGSVEQMDERPPSLLSRFGAMMQLLPPEAPVAVDTSEFLSPDAVAGAACAVVSEAAQRPPVVIVGHGAHCLLRSRPDALHLRLVATPESRAARLCARGSCDARDVLRDIRDMDAARAAYIRRYHDTDWRDASLYDLVINTSRVPIAEAAELVVALVRARGGAVATR